jgi:hypothetical protein
MSDPINETILNIGLVGLGVYFTVLLVRGGWLYARYLRLLPTAEVTWPARRQRYGGLLIGLGVLAAAVTLLNARLGRPLHHVYGQAAMTVYFLALGPLLARIRRGVYRDGVLSDRGFTAWGRISRLAFIEAGEIALVLIVRGTGIAVRLSIPPSEYGAVRKAVVEKLRSGELRVDPAVLGLESAQHGDDAAQPRSG